MLDAYIIEQIRKREEERRRILERPALRLPVEPVCSEMEEEEEEEESPRVIVIDL